MVAEEMVCVACGFKEDKAHDIPKQYVDNWYVNNWGKNTFLCPECGPIYEALSEKEW